jgi:hypothetical protein
MARTAPAINPNAVKTWELTYTEDGRTWTRSFENDGAESLAAWTAMLDKDGTAYTVRRVTPEVRASWKQDLYAELGIKPLDPAMLTRMAPEEFAGHLRTMTPPEVITLRMADHA